MLFIILRYISWERRRCSLSTISISFLFINSHVWSKKYFFQSVAMSVLLYGYTTRDLNETIREKAWRELHKNAACCFKQILEVALYKAPILWPLTSHLINHPNYKKKTCQALLNKLGQTKKWCFSMDAPMLDNQQRLTYTSTAQTLGSV